MKVLKLNSIKMWVNFSVIVLLFLTACGSSGNSNNTQAEKDEKAKLKVVPKASKMEKPKTDLQTAVVSGNLEIVKQHIEAGTDINTKDQLSGSTPLITAITFGKTDIAKTLIDANADLIVKNNEGATALHIAAFFGRIEIVQMLIDAKADKNVKNNFGATARETVIVPFSEVKPIYEMIQLQLEPFNFHLNLNEVEKNRPVIAMMLQ